MVVLERFPPATTVFVNEPEIVKRVRAVRIERQGAQVFFHRSRFIAGLEMLHPRFVQFLGPQRRPERHLDFTG